MNRTLLYFIAVFLSYCSYSNAQTDVLLSAQKMPSFIGGNDSIASILSNELNKHPEFLSKTSFSGKCFINFIIDENGELQNLNLIKGISNKKFLNDVIIETFNKIKPWNAGENKGEQVKVAMSYTFSVKQEGSKFKVKLEDH